MPTRGTTRVCEVLFWGLPISIHVPTRGTTSAWRSDSCNENFNPRAHEGHDRIRFEGLRLRWNFNPRAHEGHDKHLRKYYSKNLFQSTCPRGARLQTIRLGLRRTISIHVPTRGTTHRYPVRPDSRDFNPRAHEGHDLKNFL